MPLHAAQFEDALSTWSPHLSAAALFKLETSKSTVSKL